MKLRNAPLLLFLYKTNNFELYYERMKRLDQFSIKIHTVNIPKEITLQA
jgi:hypothetical protein